MRLRFSATPGSVAAAEESSHANTIDLHHRLTLGLVASLGTASSVWAAEARTLTDADLADLGGTDFDGGPGDYLLRNNRVEAVILGITATPDFDIPIVAEALPGRGVIVDLGTVGDKNDQLTEIDHVVNIAANVIFYGGPAEGLPAPVFVSGGATASITVSGVVLLPASAVPPFPGSSFDFPTLFATTTYSVTDGQPWVDIETTVTNVFTALAPVFSIGDADILAGRGRIPFQPMEDRGHKPPLLDLSAPESAIGVWNYLSLPGNNGPEDGPANNDGSPSGKVTYTFVADSVFAPLIGIADQNVAVIGNFFNLAEPGGIPPVDAAPANTLTFKRKLVVTKDNTVESGLDVALPLLYGPIFGEQDLRATFNGKVVDGNGVGVPDAHVFVDNTVPGAPDLSPLISVLDENLDGIPDDFADADGTDPLPFSHTVTAADGTFTLKLQALPDPPADPSEWRASQYTLTVNAESRGTEIAGPLVVDPAAILGGPTTIPDIVLSDTGTVSFAVTDVVTGLPTAAKLTFVGMGGTPDPDFGNQFLTRRDFSLIQPNGPFPLHGGRLGGAVERHRRNARAELPDRRRRVGRARAAAGRLHGLCLAGSRVHHRLPVDHGRLRRHHQRLAGDRSGSSTRRATSRWTSTCTRERASTARCRSWTGWPPTWPRASR